MITPPLRIYIPIEEGGGLCHAPVPCKRLADGSYEILPDDQAIFDDEDNSQLYKFGPGDIATAETKQSNRGPELFARNLIRSGSKVNDLKRLMFTILEENPKPSILIGQHGNDTVRRLLTKLEKADTWIYPGIREYVKEHRSILEEAL
ncbi:MAG: hypothetical protein KGJ84_07290 [Elusimicrobia bacterium]|nr:hypothetical protein [Elusimicrobiota bacterium]